MQPEKITAIVLRVIEFSETSSVVTLFSREFGKLRGLAKGARRLKGPFESALDLLAVCRLVFLAKTSDALDLLTEAKLERRFRPPGRELSNLYAAYYVAELLNELTHDRDPHPELFDAASAMLVALAEAGAPVARLVLQFELCALRLLGHLPSLDSCVECGAPAPPSGRVAFGFVAGGVLCARCRPGKKQVVSLSSAALQALRALADSARVDGLPQVLDRRVYGELRGTLNQFIAHLLGRKPRLQAYLASVQL